MNAGATRRPRAAVGKPAETGGAAAAGRTEDLPVRRDVRVDGARIVYAEAGGGEPVVLLHGYPQSRLCWRHLFPELARRRRVVAPDWVGWGESDRPLDLSFRYDDEVARIGRFLDAVGIDRASLVVHDYGAHLALGFVARHPDRVDRLAILNSRAHRTFPPAGWLLFAGIGLAARTAGLRTLLENAPLPALHRWLLAPHVRRGCFDAGLRDRTLEWMSTREGRRWYVRFFQDYVLREPDLTARLPGFGGPVAVVWGDRDPWCPAWIAAELGALFPDVSVTWVRGASHFVMEERPRDVLGALEELFARPPVPRPARP